MAKDTYRVSPDGGYYVLKDGVISGWVPPSHPLNEVIEARASKGDVILLPALPVQPPQDPGSPQPTLEQLVSALVSKGVITMQDLVNAGKEG